MEGDSREGESCQQFLDLIPNERDWLVRDRGSFQVTEEKKLELRLGPPGDWISKENCSRERHEESLLSLGYFPKAPKNSNPSAGAKRGFSDTVVAETGADSNSNQKVSSQKPAVLFQPPPWSSSPSASAFQKSAFLQFQMQSIPSLPVLGKESSHANASKVEMQQAHEKNPCSSASVNANAAVASNSQTRTASVPVVGWPPIRSFRKNIGNSSLKPAPESQNAVSEPKEKIENCRKGLFVKINMDGVPIGRKVDLKAYDSYEKLSCAVDELFRALLAAQRDSTAAGNQNTAEEMPPITGLLDGNGEYTLVYEDNEGDRMLVGDVPWGQRYHNFQYNIIFPENMPLVKDISAMKMHVCNYGEEVARSEEFGTFCTPPREPPETGKCVAAGYWSEMKKVVFLIWVLGILTSVSCLWERLEL